jgi:regulatory protein
MPAKRQPLSLKGRALALLAQREQSISELRRKLLRHWRATSQLEAESGADPIPVEDDAEARVDEVIAWLQTHNYLSEERFVESRVNARAGRYGNLRIRQELAQHGVVMTSDVAQALKDTSSSAHQVWQRKFGVAPASAARAAARFPGAAGFLPSHRGVRARGPADVDDD